MVPIQSVIKQPAAPASTPFSLPADRPRTGKRNLLREVARHRYLYALMLPGLALLAIYRYLPMLGLVIAFKDYNFAKGILGSEWVGFYWFDILFARTYDFWRIVRNNLVINLYELVIAFPFPIALALMLNEVPSARVRRLSQTAVYLPHFVSWVIFAGIIIQLLSPSHGIVNQALKLLGREPIFFLAHPEYFRSIVVFTAIWKNAGWGSIIYLAAISTIDQELYESAHIDGATRRQRAWHITIPCISATIVVMLLIRIGNILDVGFEQVYVLQNPLVYETGDIIETYVYRVGLGRGQFSLTTAVGMFKSVIGLVLIYVSNTAARKLFGRNIW